MRRMWAASAAMVMSLALGGMAALAQTGDDGSRVTQFSGTIIEERFHAEGESHVTLVGVGGVTRSTGNILEWTVEWTDPRLPSTMWHRLDYDLYDPDSALPYATSVLLLGEDGSWTGIGRGIGYDEGFVQVVLEGDGGYEGQYIILDRKDATLADGSATRTFDGFIVEGELTPMPDPVEPPGGSLADAPTYEASEAVSTEEPVVVRDEGTEVAGDEGEDELSGSATYIEGLRTWQYWEGEDTIYELEMSDPRASGTYTETIISGDGYDGDSTRPSVVGLVDVTLVNDKGSWSGLESGVWDDEMGWHLTAWLAGDGAHEGLALYLHAHRFPVYSTPEMDFVGIIFEGEPPVMLEAVQVPAE